MSTFNDLKLCVTVNNTFQKYSSQNYENEQMMGTVSRGGANSAPYKGILLILLLIIILIAFIINIPLLLLLLCAKV